MTTEWNPENYEDTYRERVEDLIERKRRGEEIVTEAAPPEDAKVVDLADALRRSLQAHEGGPAGSRPGRGTPAKSSGAARSAGGKSAGSGTKRTRPAGKTASRAKSSPKRKAS
jgi:DNA end-binding protein Ku